MLLSKWRNALVTVVSLRAPQWVQLCVQVSILVCAIPAIAQSNKTTMAGTDAMPAALIGAPSDDQRLSNVAAASSAIVPQIPKDYKNNIALQTVYVDQFRFEGNTALDAEIVAAILDKYRGRELAFEELQVVRSQLTRAYIQRGFVSSGVLIPDQEITGGVVRLLASESKLGNITVDGNRHLNAKYLESRIRDKLGPVLNVYELERALRLMQERPLVGQINAELRPDGIRGGSILNLRVREESPIAVSLGFNNRRTPNVGEDQQVFTLSHLSLTGRADYLLFNYALAEGVNDVYVAYGIPLTPDDLTLELHYAEGKSDIIESSFEDLDIVSDTQARGLKLFRPVIHTEQHKLTLGLAFDNQQTESYLLGDRFSFAVGEQAGKSEVSVLRLSVDWIWRRERDAMTLQGRVSQGVDWLDATDNSDVAGDVPDSDFTSLMLQSHYARRLVWRGSQFLGRVSLQAARDPLLAVEKLAVGGVRTVRGYRENQLVRDEGLIASMELRFPLFLDDTGKSAVGLSFAPFVDYGIARDKKTAVSGHDDHSSTDIASIGAGLIWHWWEPLYAEIYYGDELLNVDDDNDSLQERGFHFQASFRWAL